MDEKIKEINELLSLAEDQFDYDGENMPRGEQPNWDGHLWRVAFMNQVDHFLLPTISRAEAIPRLGFAKSYANVVSCPYGYEYIGHDRTFNSNYRFRYRVVD